MTPPTTVGRWEREGTAADVGGNAPFFLDDPNALWLVVAGSVDVFAVRRENGRVAGPRRYLWTVGAGEAVLGVADEAAASGLGLLAVGVSGTRVTKIAVSRLKALAEHRETATEVASLIDAYVLSVSDAVAGHEHPQLHTPLAPGNHVVVKRSQRAGPNEGVVWVYQESGTSSFAGENGARITRAESPIPIGKGLWLTAVSDEVRLSVLDTAACIDREHTWKGLDTLRAMFLQWVAQAVSAEEELERQRLQHQAEAQRRMTRRGLAGLATILVSAEADRPMAVEETPLMAACRAVGKAPGIEFRAPPAWALASRISDPLGAICRASRVRFRRVALRGEWWETESGPLLAYWSEARAPVAALPARSGRYEVYDPAHESRIPVDSEVAARLEPFAYSFYRPAPEEPIGRKKLAQLALQDVWRDLGWVLLMALAGGALGLMLPIATRKMFSEVIPSANRVDIVTLVAALVGITLGTALFELTRAFALVRMEGKSNASLQAMVIDRLLSLPVPFFRKYAVGDLAQRAGGINAVRDVLSGAAVTSILSGVFSILYLGLMFYYNSRLAWVAVGLVVLAVIVTSVLGVVSLRFESRRQDAAGKIAGHVFQMIGGVAKLRVAGAEGRVFAVWSGMFRTQEALAVRAGTYKNVVKVFNDLLPTMSLLALFAMAGYLVTQGTDINTGTFIAFNTAFGAFFASGVSLSNTMITLIAIGPLLKRAKPILETLPEVHVAKPDPGELTGHIEGNHLSFRYKADGPLILDDVSFRTEPGEFVAFVGPSGSGKSTTLRLLLGFESPESGSIVYNSHELSSVDVSAVRSQIGVVLQSSRLLAGDVFTNIVGSAPLSRKDAWEAAEMAGLADDLRDMPMGMQTVISEGGSTLSGGQRQRLLIARALVRKPRIILFDEATSALDNRTQEQVSKSLDRIDATRIVIAHRLSTIRNADRIYVMERGRIVQQGSFEQLIEQPGLFTHLIARQVA